MTVEEMLGRMGSDEITDWAAIFAIEDEEAEDIKNNKDGKLPQRDNEDLTDALIASIDRDREGN